MGSELVLNKKIEDVKKGNELMSYVSNSFENVYGEKLEDFLPSNDNKQKANLSFQNFILSLANQKVSKYSNGTKTQHRAIDIIMHDFELKFTFLKNIADIVNKNGFDFTYTYAFLRNSKDTSSGYTLDFGIQYQTEWKILENLGYKIMELQFVLEGDDFVKKSISGEITTSYEQKNFALYNTLASINFNNTTESEKIINNLINKIKLGFAWIKDKNGDKMYFEIAGDKLRASVNSSLQRFDYQARKEVFNLSNFKIKSGLLGMLKITMIHRIYDEFINHTQDDISELNAVGLANTNEKVAEGSEPTRISQEEYYAKIRAEQDNKTKEDEQVVEKDLSNIKQADQLNNADDATILINETQNFKKILEVIKKENEKDMITLNAVSKINDIEAIAQDYIDSDHKFSQKAFLIGIIQRIKLEKLTQAEQFRYCGTPLADADKFNGYQL